MNLQAKVAGRPDFTQWRSRLGLLRSFAALVRALTHTDFLAEIVNEIAFLSVDAVARINAVK